MLANELYATFLELVNSSCCTRSVCFEGRLVASLPGIICGSEFCLHCQGVMNASLCLDFLRLAQSDEVATSESGASPTIPSAENISSHLSLPYPTGAPGRPYTAWVFRRMEDWVASQTPPFTGRVKASTFGFEAAQWADDKEEEHVSTIAKELQDLAKMWADVEARPAALFHFLKQVSVYGVFYLLGMRHSPGTTAAFPPSLEDLRKAFKSCHAKELNGPKAHAKDPGDLLSVGAKALCKHAIRSENSFWGEIKGNTRKKKRTSAG
eukprot:Rmarinus@m.29137